MKRVQFGVLLCALALILSCASVQLVTRAKEAAPSYKAQLEGRSIGIVPFEVSFGASRFAVDLRGVTVKAGDAVFQLQNRYVAMDKDDWLGNVGILDVDILTKSKADKEAIALAIADYLKAGMEGALDYHLEFFKGLGEGNMGELSNRPIEYDRSVYPPAVTFKSADSPKGFYTEVRVLPAKAEAAAAGTDLVLMGDVSISSEVLEVLSVPEKVAERYRTNPTKLPKAGDYYLSLFGSMRFKLVDAKTGALIATDKSARDWPVKDAIADNIPIPAKKGDADAYAKYFRSIDFTPIVLDAVKKATTSIIPLVAPYFVNTTHQVVAEK